jgi:DNA-binding transcriptional MerR regulator
VGELIAIGEFSAMSLLSVKMLRYYHEVGLLEPAHVDPTTGYRYYDPDQARVARSILELRHLGMPLGEIRVLLVATDAAEARDVLARHRQRLAGQLIDAERRLALIEELVVEDDTMREDITEVDLPRLRVATARVEGPQAMTAPLVTAAFAELHARLQHQRVELTGPPIQVVHHGDEEHFEHEVCIPIASEAAVGAEVEVRDLEAGPVALVRGAGALDQASLLVHSVMGWLRGRGHEPVMPFRVTLLALPPLFAVPEVADADEPVFEIAVPYR